MISQLIDYIVPALFRFFVLVITALPERFTLKTGEFLGRLLYYFWIPRRKIAIEAVKKTSLMVKLKTNLSPHSIVKKSFINLGRSFIEIIRLYGGDRSILKRVKLKGIENFDRAKAEGKGIIFLTGHCGNWELMALAFGNTVEPIGVVARPLNSRQLNKLIEKIRCKFGNHVIYKKGAVREILKFLRENRAVGILMDQSVLRQEGILIDFLGRPAWTSRTPAMIAKKTGAKVLPAFIKRDGEWHIIEIGKEVQLKGDELEDTKKLSSYIETYIMEHPTEWLWIHRRWKERS
ncbi:MAG: lysophospholipid acyltransferase family protein [Thermodesulfovibrionales bacterium]|nr:lysophospholipid acyltransferase family protein [Thermodesulfovibrionales bacterium]